MAASDRLMKVIIARLSEVMVREGFVRCGALDGKGDVQPGKRYPRWRVAWFAADGGVPGVTAAISAELLRGSDGTVGFSGSAWLMSDAVAGVRSELPREALETVADGLVPGCVETIPFGQFEHPRNVGMATMWIGVESQVDYCVGRFVEDVRGSVGRWFEQRASLAALLDLARTPKLTSLDQQNPDGVRLRGVVILALLQGRVQEAVSLMAWYRGRDQYNAFDSAERVAAFDAALSVRFPAYAAARQG